MLHYFLKIFIFSLEKKKPSSCSYYRVPTDVEKKTSIDSNKPVLH